MRQDNREAARAKARATLAIIGSDANANFFGLRQSQVEQLLREADLVKYRQPKNANGSRARYFFARLQRQANKKT